MPVTTTVKLDLARDSSFSTSISQYLISASVHQGRQKSLDSMQPATATVKLNNADGRFSPLNASSPYYPDFNDDFCGIRIEAGTRRFTGYIIEITQDPFIQNQEITLQCIDRLGLLAEQVISAGLFRLQPVHLILNRLIDLMEKGEEIDNPGGEDLDGDGSGDTTGYSAAKSGTTISAISTMSFEGDYCIQAVCDGSVSGQGIRYDLGAEVTGWKAIALLARTVPGDGDVTLNVRGITAALGIAWSTTIDVVDGAWTHKQFLPYTGHRYIQVSTQSAVALTILLDCLHQIPLTSFIFRLIPTTLDAVVEQLGLYEAPGLESLNKLVATEAAGFLYMRDFGASYGVIFASAQTVRDGKTTPSATFGDDGVNVPYVGLSFGLDAKERISRAAVRSEGSYEDAGEEGTIWELLPKGQVVPAGETKVFHAQYSQPARGCTLSVNPDGSPVSYPIAASGNDGYIRRWEETNYPPDANEVVATNAQLIIGQDKSTIVPVLYRVWRSYLRFDTSGIGAGETCIALKLKMRMLLSQEGIAFTLQARVNNWGPSLEVGDWGEPPLGVQGSISTENMPPVGQWFEFDLNVVALNKIGWTQIELTSDREVAETAPTGAEYISLYDQDSGYPAQLHVTLQGVQPASKSFRHYGTGARIEIGAGDEDLVTEEMTVKGVPLTGPSEESVVIAEASSPPAIPRSLPVDMPYQGTRTADMEAEAVRLVERHSGVVRRLRMLLQEEDAASLAQMQVRELDDLVRVINTKWDFSTGIDDLFFIEAIEWEVKDQGRVLEVMLDLEEK